MRLEGKTALISGATGAIGAATCRLYHSEGANIVMVGRTEEKLQDLIASFDDKSKLRTIVANSQNENEIQTAVQFANDQFGSLDIVLANAGTEGAVKQLTEFTVDEFNEFLSINVVGVWLYMKHSIPLMQKQRSGSFIAVSSGGGVVGFNGQLPYIASKHAVIGMVKTACIENGQYNVRVNALAPGPVDNRMMRSLEEQLDPSDPEGLRESIISQMIPLRKYSTNEDVANLALFLGSDESANCSGAVFLSDGGFTAA